MADDAWGGDGTSNGGPSAHEVGAENGTTVERAKFDLGGPLPAFDAPSLPWGYGEDRITALVRSPDSVYLYWEITDEGLAAARTRLGPRGEHGWCNLRVYDTTDRAFDGVNANDYFDVRVERADREWFLELRRPGASFHVEIGVKTDEGYFQAIARSGRADFPRKSPSPNHALEWMTVTSDDAPPAARPCTSKYDGPPPGSFAPERPPPPRAPSSHAIVAGGPGESRTFTWTHPAHVEVRWEGPWLFHEWKAQWRLNWAGGRAVLPIENAQWVSGPFPVEVLASGRIEVRLLGEGPVVLEEHTSGLEVFGPWHVTIRSFDAGLERRVIGAWRVHWIRVEPAKVERWWTAIERQRISSWQRTRVVGGASEAHAIIEGGASEAWRIGASEVWMQGASEWVAAGASEVAWLGASQLSFAGASALLYGGASERHWGGASEWRWGGASEWHLGGASEWMHAGASEMLHMGSSEHFAASAPLGWR